MTDIRIKALKDARFTNWSETFSCSPELFFAPKSEDELHEILQLAKSENKRVKVFGCGHSPSDIAFTDDVLISLQYFNQVISIDEEKQQITVQAGMHLNDLNEILSKHGLAMSVLGSVSNLTVGGAISTGTHGSGIEYGIISSYVVALKLLTSEGRTIDCSSSENEEIFSAARCSLGALGIILDVTLQCEKSFMLLQNQYGAPLRDIIENLDVHLKASDHFRFMYFPYTENVVVSHVKRTNLPVQKPSFWSRICTWFMDYGLGYYTLEFCYYLSTFFPALVPLINRTFYSAVRSRPQKHIDVSYKVFNFECLFKQYVNEWAIDLDKTGEVLWQLKQWIETNDVFVHFPIEVRFAKSDDILISPAYGRDTCYINIIMYRPYGVTVPYEKYWLAYEKIMEEAGGRPHWAKAHKVTQNQFMEMYPKFQRWCEIRKMLDPRNMFSNNYIERIFKTDLM